MKKLLFLLLMLLNGIGYSQVNQQPYKVIDSDPEWVRLMYQPNPNLFQLRDAFDAYYQNHPFEKNKHTQYFKRLLKENWSYVNTDGYIEKPAIDQEEEARFLEKKLRLESKRSPTSEWQEMGPWDYDHEQAMTFQVQSPGSAHVYVVAQDPNNSNIVYAGTATAGLWKSIDKGLNWSLITKNLLVNSVYSLAIDPTNSNRVFFGEENGTIWRSEDAGASWTPTGSTTFQLDNKWIHELKWIGASTLLAATNAGLFRTTDNGANWTLVHAEEHTEIEIQPGTPSTLYTVRLYGSKTEFYKSIDNGLTWVIKTIGWPLPVGGDEQKRTEIGVTSADPNIVYVFAAGVVGNNDGLYGVYKSTDAGETFNFTCCGSGPGGPASISDPNLLGYSGDGAEVGGQIYYCLAFGASPTNADRVFGAGINVWRSENGGANWDLNAHWVTWVGQHTAYRYNHADVHNVQFFEYPEGVDMWVCSDGGLYYSSDQGDTLEPRMHGIQGTDFWGFQAGFKDGDVMVGGTYHNGTLIKYKDIYHGGLTTPESGGWLAERGGDNCRGFVNYSNSQIGYDDGGAFKYSPIREVRKTDLSFSDDNKCNTSYVDGEYGNYAFSATNPSVFYSPVGTKLMLTENGGTSFTEVYNFGGSKVIQVKVAWSNPDIIYVTRKPTNGTTRIMKSINKGVNWVDVTPTSAQTSNNQNRSKYIEVDNEDPNKLWCILMGSQNGNKVFQSTDGGLTWVNITTSSINTERVVSIFHHYGTDDGLYIGTKRAVYYKNNNMAEWTLFNNNLPASVACAFVEPFYAGGKIRTASQRGVYECDFYEDVPPVAMISSDKQQLNIASDCLADSVQFYDHSTVRTLDGSWSWFFEGGSPAVSSEMNPKIAYLTPGTYNVKLIVSDAFGTDSITFNDFITITSQFVSPYIVEGFEGEFPPENWKLIDSEGSSWEQDSPENMLNDKCASFPNYWVNATGQEHYLAMPAMNFMNSVNPEIAFDYTYHNNGTYEDSLALVYRTSSTDWQVIWRKGGSELSIPATDVWFWDNDVPTISWVTETVDLSFLIGQPCVELAFSNIGNYGNHIWLDNVNMTGQFLAGIGESEEMGLSIFPNPSTGNYTVRWSNYQQPTELRVYTIHGQLVQTTTVSSQVMSTEIDLMNESHGVYLLVVHQGGVQKTARLVKR